MGHSSEHRSERGTKGKQANEGEGNRTAARNYNRETRDFVKSGQVEEKAKEAARAVGGKEGEALRRAERTGESKARS
jgi:hypothetical protein